MVVKGRNALLHHRCDTMDMKVNDDVGQTEEVIVLT